MPYYRKPRLRLKLTKKSVMTILFFVLGLTGIAAAATLTRQSQDVRNQAAGYPSSPPSVGCPAGTQYSSRTKTCLPLGQGTNTNTNTGSGTVGARCNSGADCGSRNCVNGRCVSTQRTIPNGSNCLSGSQCQSGVCRSGKCQSAGSNSDPLNNQPTQDPLQRNQPSTCPAGTTWNQFTRECAGG